MYIITGEVQVKAPCRDALVELAFKQVENSLAEPGCVSYSFNEDQKQPGNFMFLERWESKEAIDIHFSMPYCIAFIQQITGLIEGKPKIEMYEIASTQVL